MNLTKAISVIELSPHCVKILYCLLLFTSSCAEKQQFAGIPMFEQKGRVVAILSILTDSIVRWIGLRHAKRALIPIFPSG
jgi:hypothetical protein